MTTYKCKRDLNFVQTGLGVLLVLLLTAPHSASAGGMSYSGAGAKGLGRAGAFAASADDPTAMFYNPANLAAMPGIQLGGGLQIPISDTCFTRAGTYGGENGDYYSSAAELELYESVYGPGSDAAMANTAQPKMCNDGSPIPVPDFGLTWRVHPMVGLGFGLVAPPGFINSVYGSKDDGGYQGTTNTSNGTLPAPTRYQLIESTMLVAYPSIAIGFAPIERLRLGLTASWGFMVAEQSMIIRGLEGEWFATDIYQELEISDAFIPRISFAVQVVAVKKILELMAYFNWADDIKAEGTINATSGYYAADGPYDEIKLDGVEVTLAQPWQAGLGIRVGVPRVKSDESGKTEKKSDTPAEQDSMNTEYADIELDVIYEINNRVEGMEISNPEAGIKIFRQDVENTVPAKYEQPLVWKDQLAIRLGADWNVLPNLLALRAGVHYETHGVEDGYEQLLLMPLQRIGVHGGVTLRLGRFDLTAGYAFIHQFDVELGPDDAKLTQIVSDIERGYGTIANEGTFTSNFHIISFGINVHLGPWS